MSSQAESNYEDEIEEQVEEGAIRYVLVEVAQLEKLLNCCFECGRMPGGRNTGKQRPIKWSKSGANMTAHWRCPCKNNAVSWSTSESIPNTRYRNSNVGIIAAAMVAPIPYVELEAFSKALGLAMFSKMSFIRTAKKHVYPVIDTAYAQMQDNLYNEIPKKPLSISMDGCFDSPGFTAEYCVVTAVEQTTNQIIEVSVTHKSETDGVSQRMEKEGVKKVVDWMYLGRGVEIDEITIDKNPSVMKYLREEAGITYNFDPWHIIKKMRKLIRERAKKIKDEEERTKFKELGRRLMLHVFYCIEAEMDGDIRWEKIMSFFLHIQDIHNWSVGDKFNVLIHADETTKTGPAFNTGTFQHSLSCAHKEDHESTHEAVSYQSPHFQFLLEMVTSLAFTNDLAYVKYGNWTSEVESSNNIQIIYHPKRKFYPRRGFEIRTKLAVLHFNHNKMAEARGERGKFQIQNFFSFLFRCRIRVSVLFQSQR